MEKNDKQNHKCYQWKKGDNYGKVDKTQSEKKVGEIDYLVFESGRLINKNLIEEFLVEIPSLTEPLFTPEEIPAEQKTSPRGKPSHKAIKPQNDYPTEEELANSLKDGKYSLGKAEVVPHPDDLPPQPLHGRVDNFAAGLEEDGRETRSPNNFTAGLEEDNRRPQKKLEDPFISIIDKAKKKEFELNIQLKIKLPATGFFEMLDEDYLNNNLDGLLNSLINKIKQSDLDSQIKENLIRIYNIETCKQEDITTEEIEKD